MGIFEEKAYKGVLCAKNSECGKSNYEISRLGKRQVKFFKALLGSPNGAFFDA